MNKRKKKRELLALEIEKRRLQAWLLDYWNFGRLWGRPGCREAIGQYPLPQKKILGWFQRISRHDGQELNEIEQVDALRELRSIFRAFHTLPKVGVDFNFENTPISKSQKNKLKKEGKIRKMQFRHLFGNKADAVSYTAKAIQTGSAEHWQKARAAWIQVWNNAKDAWPQKFKKKKLKVWPWVKIEGTQAGKIWTETQNDILRALKNAAGANSAALSCKELAQTVKLTTSGVTQALTPLRKAGLVAHKAGAGYYLSKHPPQITLNTAIGELSGGDVSTTQAAAPGSALGEAMKQPFDSKSPASPQ